MQGRVPILIVLFAVALAAIVGLVIVSGDDAGGIDFGSIVIIAIIVFVGLAVGLGMARRGTEPEPPPEPDEQRRRSRR